MATRPNILFIFSDQHNARILGCAGDPVVRTPNLDRLATESVVFRQAYCQNPLCVPSRTTLMTGQYCRTHGLYENPDIMEPNSPTFPRTLSAVGYRTCLIGKSHFNGEQFHGYQQRPYGDLYGQGHQPDPCRPPNEREGGSGLGGMVENAGPTGIPLPLTQTEICVAETAKWLQAHCELHADQPFCLSLHFDKPHFPVRCPTRYFSHYDGLVSAPDVPEGYAAQAVPFVQRAIRCFGGRRADTADRYVAALLRLRGMGGRRHWPGTGEPGLPRLGREHGGDLFLRSRRPARGQGSVEQDAVLRFLHAHPAHGPLARTFHPPASR